MTNIPYQIIDWEKVERTEHRGEKGVSFWKTVQFEGLRIREVEYGAGYIADHWCEKGHIIYCVEGEVISELKDGTKSTLTPGMSYMVSDGLSSHRSISEKGGKFIIIDGDFLKRE